MFLFFRALGPLSFCFPLLYDYKSCSLPQPPPTPLHTVFPSALPACMPWKMTWSCFSVRAHTQSLADFCSCPKAQVMDSYITCLCKMHVHAAVLNNRNVFSVLFVLFCCFFCFLCGFSAVWFTRTDFTVLTSM